MSVPSSASWTIKKIFKLMIKYIIGKGSKTFLWLDNWHHLGPLLDRLWTGSPSTWGGYHAKVDSIIRESSWCWPRRRNVWKGKLLIITPSTFLPNPALEDVIWSLNAKGFSIKSAWDAWASLSNVCMDGLSSNGWLFREDYL